MEAKQHMMIFITTIFFLTIIPEPIPAQDVVMVPEEPEIMIVTSRYLPDLAVTSADVWVSGEGNYIMVDVEIANQGNKDADSFVVYIGSGRAGLKETRVKIPGLKSEQETKERIEIEFPENLRGRKIVLRIETDPENEISEWNEENNFWRYEIDLKPDLEIREVAVRISEDRNHVILDTEIVNSGNDVVEAFSVIAGAPWIEWPDKRVEVTNLGPGRETVQTIELEIPEEQRDRWIVLRVEVDPEDKIWELNEKNNIKRMPDEIYIPPKAPDIVISSARASISDDLDYVIINLNIDNQGNKATGYFTVSAGNPSQGWPETKIGIEGLEAGSNTMEEIKLLIQEAQREKYFNFRAEVDSGGTVEEIDEENNGRWTRSIYIPPKLPDLTVTYAGASVSDDGDRVVLEFEIENEGSRDSENFFVAVGNPREGWPETRIEIGNLAPEKTIKKTLEFEISEVHRGRETSFQVKANPDKRIRELDERNNIEWTPKIIIPRKLPELAIWYAEAYLSEDEDCIILEIECGNEGNAGSENFWVCTENVEKEWEEAWIEIPGLNEDESTTEEILFEVSEEQRGKSFEFRIELDPAEEIREFRTENNIETLKISIPEKLPDLVIFTEDWEITDDKEWLVLFVEIENQGNAHTGEFTVFAEGTHNIWQKSEIEIFNLAPGESTVEEIELRIPEEERGNECSFWVQVDPENHIQETDEENNAASTSSIYIPPIFPLEIIVTVVLTVVLGGGSVLLGGKKGIRIYKHRKWEKKAIEKEPEECQPNSKYCLKGKPKLRSIKSLSLTTEDPDTGNEIKKDIDGETAEKLNRALRSSYKNEKPEKIRSLTEAAASKILEEIGNWLNREKGSYDISISIHMEGSEVTGTYILKCCDESGQPIEEEKWEKTCKDKPDKNLGCLKNLIPSEPGMQEKQIVELTNMLDDFIDNICLFPPKK